MLRLLIAACAVCFATIAHAQSPTVLLHNPPVYRNSEGFRGSMLMQDGTRVALNQHVAVSRGKTFMFQNAIARGSQSYYSVMDVDTLVGFAIIGRMTARTLSSTCAGKALYPLILNKTYQCEEQTIIDKKPETIKRTVLVSRADFRQGRLTGYCTEEAAALSKGINKAEICYTPDGKWVTHIRYKEFVPRFSI